MIGFAETFGATIASFIFPAIVGLVIISAAARFMNARYLAAFAIGIYFWFFTDTMGDANLLGANEGFEGGIPHAALWIAFGVGLILILALDKEIFTPGPDGLKLGFAIPLLVAIAVGIHGFGEGAELSATAVSAPTTNMIDAFGGLSGGVAFVLHKALEPMMVGATYWLYARDHAKDISGRAKDIIILALAFTLPGIIGGASSYFIVQAYPDVDFTYVFALGLGTSIYAAARLARGMFGGPRVSGSDSTKMALMILLGFTCLYLAAMLHS